MFFYFLPFPLLLLFMTTLGLLAPLSIVLLMFGSPCAAEFFHCGVKHLDPADALEDALAQGGARYVAVLVTAVHVHPVVGVSLVAPDGRSGTEKLAQNCPIFVCY